MNVYLSSTYLDLRRHRKAIPLALRKAQYQGTMMEEYAGARCDAYVEVFAWRYGYLPKGKGNLKRVSAAELEYAAAKRKKNRLCCSCSRFDHWSLANGFLTAGVGSPNRSSPNAPFSEIALPCRSVYQRNGPTLRR